MDCPQWTFSWRARQQGSAAKPARTLLVEVSFDDGAARRKAKLTKHGHSLESADRKPRPGCFVSLRAASTDTAGNTVEQTVIRAYRIAG
jgi:hypothetical protein